MANPFSGFVGQCVGFVERVYSSIGFAQSGPGAAADYITSQTGSLPAQGWTQRKDANSTQPGDIIVFQRGAAGMSSSFGHIAIVSEVNGLGTSGGNVRIAQANAAGDQQVSLGTVTESTLTSKGVSVWAAPSRLAGKAASLAQQAGSDLGTGPAIDAANRAGSTGTGAAAAGQATGVTEASNAAPCESLAQIFDSPVANIPVVGGLWAGVSAPEKLVQWISQPCVRWRAVLFAGVLVAAGMGAWLMFRKEVEAGAGRVVKLVGSAAA